MNERQELNLEILRQLTHYIKMYPDQRFGQALVNLGVLKEDNRLRNDSGVSYLDPFYEEPKDMLARIRETKKKS